MTPPKVRSPYNYDMNEAGDESGLKCMDKSLTQQSEADATDINWMVNKYVVTGEMPQLQAPPIQGDFTEVMSYQDALNLMIDANKSFMQLPAKVRNRFENDPGKFIDFASNEANRDEMRQMGMWSPEANARFEAKAQAQKEQEAANAAAAAELKALKKGQTSKPT